MRPAPASDPGTTLAEGTATPRRMPRGVVPVLALATGAAVANLYYAQPLLTLIGRSLHVADGTAALVVTLTQVGYAAGLLLLLPLGDLVENRALATRILGLTAVALVGAAVSPSFVVLLVALAAVGVTSVVAQVLVPLAANLAPEESRGRVVGQVTSGLLLGIMLARTVSSFVASAWGWRGVFAASAVLMVVVAVCLRLVLPERRPASAARYGGLLRSTVQLVPQEPLLVRRALTQGLLFAAFTAYWTGVTFELIDRHGFDQTDIALFALVGAAGAAVAPVAGRLGDRGLGSVGRLAAAATAVVAMLVAGFGAGSVVALAVGGVLLDLAVQGHQVLSLRDVYALRPEARARLNAVYMTTIFVAGALASAATGVLAQHWGWHAVTTVGGACALGAVTLWRRTRTPAPVPAAG